MVVALLFIVAPIVGVLRYVLFIIQCFVSFIVLQLSCDVLL